MIIDELNDIIALGEVKQMTTNEYMKHTKTLFSIIRSLEEIEKELEPFKRVATAIRGLRKNHYLRTYHGLQNASIKVKRDIKSLEFLTQCDFRNRKLSTKYFEFELVILTCERLKKHVVDYFGYLDDSIELHKKALRYDESSMYNKQDGDTVLFLDITTEDGEVVIVEQKFTFKTWEQWHSDRRLSPSDGKKWSILMKLYPEEYL